MGIWFHLKIAHCDSKIKDIDTFDDFPLCNMNELEMFNHIWKLFLPITYFEDQSYIFLWIVEMNLKSNQQIGQQLLEWVIPWMPLYHNW